jgi:hypothetical protein
MERIIYLEVLDVVINKLLVDSTHKKIKPSLLLKYIENKYSVNNAAVYCDIKESLANIFPLYNNNKNGTKWYKINRTKAIEYIKNNKIILKGDTFSERVGL